MSDAPESTSDATQTKSFPTSLRYWGRRAVRIIGIALVGLILLVGGLLVFLQTEVGATATAQLLAARANPLTNTELTLEKASGSWITSIRLTGVKLTREDGGNGPPVEMAQVDTISARYHLLPLLKGRLHLSSVSVIGPDVTLRQAADSTWDWVERMPEGSEQADTTGGMSIQVDRVSLKEGTFTAEFFADGRDSTARIQDLRVLASDIESSSAVTGRLDTLDLRAQVPGAPPDLRLTSSASLSSNALTLDTLRLSSPRSQVRGGGRVQLPSGPTESVGDVGLRLSAAPLSLRDLAPFAPTLDVDPNETVQLDLHVNGSDRMLRSTLDAQFSDGGSVFADAQATPRTTPAVEGELLEYQLDAQVENLTTSLLGPADTTQNHLNAAVTVDLSGPSLTGLSGTADVRVTDTRWKSLQSPQLTLTSTFRDGEAQLNVDGTLNGASIGVTGRTRPLDETVNATLTAWTQDLDVGEFLPGTNLESAITASSEIQIRRLGTETQTVDLDLSLESSRIGEQTLRQGRASFALRSDNARFSGRLSLPAGALDLAGYAALDGTQRFALEEARFTDFNVAALVGDTTANRVTGMVQIRGQGYTPETMQLQSSVQLRDTHYGAYHLSSLSTKTTLSDARLKTATQAILNGSAWSLAATGRPFESTPTFELTRGRFENVDIGPFLQDTTQSSTITGTLYGSVQGLNPDSMTVEAGLRLDSSQVNDQAINDATLDLRLRAGQLDADFTLDTPEGGVQLAAGARPFASTPTYEVIQGSFEEINIGALIDQQRLTTALSGTLGLRGRGATGETFAIDGELAMTTSQVNYETLESGRLSFSAQRGEGQIDGALNFGSGHLAVTGQIDSLEATPTYDIKTTVGSLNAGALAGLDSTRARIDTLEWTLDGRGLDPGSLSTETALLASGIEINRFRMSEARLNGRFRHGQLALDTLTVESNAFAAEGRGTLAVTDSTASSDFGLTAQVTDPRPLRRFLDANTLQLQRGTLEARVYGDSIPNQRFDGGAELSGLLYDDLRMAEAEINFNGQRGADQLFQRLEVDGTLGYSSLPSISAEQTRFDAVYEGTATDLTANVRLGPSHRASLAAQIRSEEEQIVATLRKLNLNFEGDQWSLLQEATITSGERYRVDGFLLHSGRQQIAVDGFVDPYGPQNLVATIEEVRLGAVSALAGLSGLDGRLSGSVELTGPADGPQLDSRLSLHLRSENQEVGTLRLDANYEEFAMKLDATLTHADGGTLSADGSIPMDLRLRAPTLIDIATLPVRISIATDRFPVNWIDPFLDAETLRRVSGLLAADVEVRGTLNDPELDGTASLTDGNATLPGLNTRYSDAAATLQFSDDQVTLENAVVHSSNDGRLRAQGVINFPQLTVGQYDLKLDANDFIAIDTRAYRRAVVDGDMDLRGTTARPVLSGTVDVRSADIYYNEALSESAAVTTVPLSGEDQLTLENRFGIRLSAADTTTFDAYEAMEMDLGVRIQRNTWLRSESTPEMNVQFMGDLDLSKAPNQDPQVFGSIEVVTERSTLRQFGQEFQITEGTMTFNGDPYTPYLTLEAVYEQRARGTQGTEVQITLRLEGRPEKLSPTLSSTPPMDTRNILSYLATGRPADELLSGSSGGGNFATQMALGQASNFVENLAASELGLDVVRVQLRPSGTSYLTVGRYFTPRFFVSIEQPVTASDLGNLETTQYLPDLTLEYQLLDPLMLRALNNQQSFQVNLFFEYAY